jgi:ABC-type lipoprotein release transport system permease subunit
MNLAPLVLRVRVAIRHRRMAALGLAVLVAVGAGVVLTLAAGARRTASAPDRYTASVGGDLDTTLVQPNGRPQTSSVRALPVVRELHSVTFLTAGLDGDDDVVTFAGDGFTEPRLVAGRQPTASHEFVATKSFADRVGLHVGDHVTVRTFTQQQADDHTAFVADPAGSFEATLVGLQRSVNELDDPLPVMRFPPSLLDEPIGVVGTVSTVRLQPGVTLEAFRAALDTVPGGDSMFFQPGAVVSTSTRHAVAAQTTGLWIITGVIALAVVAALGQILAGFVRLPPSSRESLQAIGYTTAQGSAEEVVHAAAIVVAGTSIGVLGSVAASRSFPRGFARALEPDRGHFHVDGPALLMGALVIGLALLAWVAVAARLARRRRAAARPSAAADALSRAGVRPEAGVGVRFALSRDGRDRVSSWATIATLCLAVAALVGTLVFGSSLGRLVNDGATFGYNYEYVAGAPTGGPLDASTIDAARTAPGVAGAMALSQASGSIRGDDLDLVGVDPLRGGLEPVVLAGRFPASPDEVALGKVTARSLGVHVGEDVSFDADGGPVTYHVVGFVVLPSVSFGEGGGRGAAMVLSGLQRVSPETQPEQLALRLQPGTAPDDLALGAPVGLSSGQSRPPDVVNVARARSVPTVIAVVVGVLALVVLVHALLTSVRARRLDVAVLRALGADRRWITRVVHVQASVLGLVALAIGVPVGIVAGRAVYRAFAERLGLVATPSMPIVVVGSLAIAVLVLVNLSAALPARRAARVAPSILLHDS